MQFLIPLLPSSLLFFFFNDTATTEIYTLSLHDALPISVVPRMYEYTLASWRATRDPAAPDRKSTRLNSSHSQISYAVFCLKKKKRLSKHYTLAHHVAGYPRSTCERHTELKCLNPSQRAH